ncbi:24307_t:CDS:2 [Entrophospora sp. SA101]|nr:24307_t:CDS:2 [Entrophospora sp. SA101]CAJ0909896.1 10325_t:CDS:2 [Entrophospora sp. SA101]
MKTRFVYVTKSNNVSLNNNKGADIKSRNIPFPLAPQKSKSRYGNKFSDIKIFLFNIYYHLLHNNRLFFLAQHNNLTIKEQESLRNELDKLKVEVMAARSTILSAVLEQSIIYSNMRPLTIGPTYIISSDVSDHENPNLIKDLLKILSKHNKILLLGGKLDNNLLNFEEIEKISKLPNLKYLHGELIGLLNQSGTILANILERNSQSLILTLENHKSNISS